MPPKQSSAWYRLRDALATGETTLRQIAERHRISLDAAKDAVYPPINAAHQAAYHRRRTRTRAATQAERN